MPPFIQINSKHLWIIILLLLLMMVMPAFATTNTSVIKDIKNNKSIINNKKTLGVAPTTRILPVNLKFKEDINISVNRIQAGKSLKVFATVTNSGIKKSSRYTVKFYIAKDVKGKNAAALVKSMPSSSLSPKAFKNFKTTLTIPDNQKSGSWKIVAKIEQFGKKLVKDSRARHLIVYTKSAMQAKKESRKVKQKPRQAEQFQEGKELWEQETQNWEQETYDGVNGGPALERAPLANPGTETIPGIGTLPTAELPPGSMPQINTDIEMEQDYSNVAGLTQPNFTVKEIDYENGVLKIVIINSGRLVNRSPCPQLAIEFGVHGINNTERRYIIQCIDRERVITCNFAINWQETDGRKICWVKIDPDNAVPELDKSDNNFEAPIYRSKTPIVKMIGGEVEFVESGKKYRTSDAVSLLREDVSDSIKEQRIFAVKLKYDLINYGAEAISFTSKLKCGDAAVYSSDQTAQSVRLEAGERKTIYHPVWLYTNNCVSMFRVQAYTLHAPLFSDVWASITCSESLIEWLGGYRPDVVILSNTFPSRVKINERANISLTIANYGGDLFSSEKWDLNVDIIKNNTNEAVFHWNWSNLTTPEGNHCCAGGYGSFTKNVHFTPTSTGYYTYRVRGTSSRGQIFEAGGCEHGNKPTGQNETEKTVSFQVSE